MSENKKFTAATKVIAIGESNIELMNDIRKHFKAGNFIAINEDILTEKPLKEFCTDILKSFNGVDSAIIFGGVDNVTEIVADCLKYCRLLTIFIANAYEIDELKDNFDMVVDSKNYLAFKFLMDMMTAPRNNLGMTNIFSVSNLLSLMKNSGKAVFGKYKADDADAVVNAVKNSLHRILMDNAINADDVKAAILKISGGNTISFVEVNEALAFLRSEINSDAEIIWHISVDSNNDFKVNTSQLNKMLNVIWQGERYKANEISQNKTAVVEMLITKFEHRQKVLAEELSAEEIVNLIIQKFASEKIVPLPKKVNTIRVRKSPEKVNAPAQISTTSLKIIGVGGFGIRALNYLADKDFSVDELIAIDTDAIDLSQSRVFRMQIGKNLTHGSGAGNQPLIGQQAALETSKALSKVFRGAEVVVIIASSGGATGTGAAPVVAEIAKNCSALTIGILTDSFILAGNKINRNIVQSINKLKSIIDIFITIPENKIVDISNNGSKLSYVEAFNQTNKIIYRTIKRLFNMNDIFNLRTMKIKTDEMASWMK